MTTTSRASFMVLSRSPAVHHHMLQRPTAPHAPETGLTKNSRLNNPFAPERGSDERQRPFVVGRDNDPIEDPALKKKHLPRLWSQGHEFWGSPKYPALPQQFVGNPSPSPRRHEVLMDPWPMRGAKSQGGLWPCGPCCETTIPRLCFTCSINSYI